MTGQGEYMMVIKHVIKHYVKYYVNYFTITILIFPMRKILYCISTDEFFLSKFTKVILNLPFFFSNKEVIFHFSVSVFAIQLTHMAML